jgi:hypothetical protein
MKSKKFGIVLLFLAIVFAIAFSEYVYYWGLVSNVKLLEKYENVATTVPAELKTVSPKVEWNREDFGAPRYPQK